MSHIPEANHFKMSATAILAPFIQGFPKRISGSIEIYEENSCIMKIKDFCGISKQHYYLLYIRRSAKAVDLIPFAFFACSFLALWSLSSDLIALCLSYNQRSGAM